MKPTVVVRSPTYTVLRGGREKLKGLEGGFVLIANHSSHLDAPLIVGAPAAQAVALSGHGDRGGLLLRRVVASPRTHRACSSTRSPSSARRPRQEEASLAPAAASLGERRVAPPGAPIPVLVFPEGTRSKDGTEGSRSSNRAPHVSRPPDERADSCRSRSSAPTSPTPAGLALAPSPGRLAGRRRVRRADGRADGRREPRPPSSERLAARNASTERSQYSSPISLAPRSARPDRRTP